MFRRTCPRGSSRPPPNERLDMGVVPVLETRAGSPPPLAAARIRRQLTVEAAARIARLTPEEVSWLEEGRLYRFPSSDDALLAVILYATSLGIGRQEARRMAGLPLVTLPKARTVRRVAGVLLGVVVIATAAVVVAGPRVLDRMNPPTASTAGPALPPTWRVTVDVLNGNGDMNYTRTVASRIGALAYRIERVTRADRFDYPQTAVYFHPGGERLAERLARQLNVTARPLPGSGNPRRLVVVVGPPRI